MINFDHTWLSFVRNVRNLISTTTCKTFKSDFDQKDSSTINTTVLGMNDTNHSKIHRGHRRQSPNLYSQEQQISIEEVQATIGKSQNSSLIHTVCREFVIIRQCPLVPRYCWNMKTSADDTYIHIWSSHDPSAADAAVMRYDWPCTLGHALRIASV